MSDIVEPLKLPLHPIIRTRLIKLMGENETLQHEIEKLRAERDGANALVERMHEQDVLAIKAWQAAHPGSELTWPSCARLSAWCMGEVASVTAERDALKAEIEKLRTALDFYACLDHYQTHNAVAPNVVQFDRGAKARAALGEKE